MMSFKNLFISGLFVLVAISCSNKEENVLAQVGEREINSSLFMKELKSVRDKLGLPDNGEVRLNFLNAYIDKQLLINEAYARDYDSDTAAIHELGSIKTQKLLDYYRQKKVLDFIDYSDEALQTHFYKMNTKMHVRHLYADNKKTADSLYSLVSNGVSFEYLAKEVFTDPVLKNSGGDLGFMNFDEMQTDFAEAAFLMQTGDISEPVKTNNGYSIIKMIERKGNPLLTEAEFIKQKSKIVESYFKFAAEQALKGHADQLQKEIDIRFNEPVFEKLYALIKEQKDFPETEMADNHNANITDEDILLTSISGSWDIQTFRRNMLSTDISRKKWIRNKENLRDFIKGLVARNFILEKSRQENYEQSEEYQEIVREKFNQYLIDRVKEDILASISAPEDSLLKFYNNNKNNYIIPAQINMREITLDNPGKASIIKGLLLQGESFSNLAKTYSTNKRTALSGGETGFIGLYQLGSFADQIQKLKPGEWVGPLKNADVYFFLQCIEFREAETLSFNSIKSDLEKKYKEMRFDRELDKKINQLRSTTKITSYPQKLSFLKYN